MIESPELAYVALLAVVGRKSHVFLSRKEMSRGSPLYLSLIFVTPELRPTTSNQASRGWSGQIQGKLQLNKLAHRPNSWLSSWLSSWASSWSNSGNTLFAYRTSRRDARHARDDARDDA